MGEEETILFILDTQGLRVRRLPVGRFEVLRHLQGLQFQMNKFGLGARYARRHLAGMREAAESHLRRLGDLLLGGIAAEVPAGRWVVAPHDVLHYVPFHALCPAGRWILDDRQVSVAPSASALRLSLAIEGGRAEERSLVLGVGGKGLPGVGREVEEVAGLLPSAHLLRDRQATWEALRTESARCRFLHLSTHGIYRPDNPDASALKLADRWLTVREVGDLRLRSDLVVLSACHTGLNRILSGDEQTGLSRAFLQAGAPSLVTTLWAVQDHAMSLWMSDFYRALLGSGTGGPAAALRQASLLARERNPHPYFWAPCLLVGNPGLPGERSVAKAADPDYI
jgi:CHAT domain-containing protein